MLSNSQKLKAFPILGVRGGQIPAAHTQNRASLRCFVNYWLLPAGVHGSRTHPGPQRGPTPILKTGKPTGTYALPWQGYP